MNNAPRSTPGPLAPVMLGLWFGIMSGLLEALARLAMKGLAGISTHLGAYLAWMPALANAVLFAGLGAVFAVAAVVPRLRNPRLWLAVFSYLCALNLLWVWSESIAVYALVILSAGVAYQVTRTLVPRFDKLQRLVNWSAPALLLILLLTAGGIEGWRAWRERRLAGAAVAAAGQPNVLLLVLDTVRSLNLGTYGYFRDTSPTMTAVGRRGVVFERTIAVTSWTLPSHAAMFTGRWMHEQGTGWKDPLDDRWPTIAEELGKRGYTSGGFIANLNYLSREYGLARGFGHYEDYEVTWRQALRSSQLGLWVSRLPWVDRRFGPRFEWTRKHAGELAQRFLDWEARQSRDRPWFGFINFFDAHREYWSPRDYRTMFADDSALAPAVPRFPPPPNSGRRYGRIVPVVEYDRAIRYTDDEIGKILTELERRGVLQNTIVIITSDHGEEFEEHGFVGHGNSLYLPSLAVPLVMALPGRVPENVRVTQTVSIRDIPATIMDLVGPGAESPFPGTSLARYWRAEAPTTADTVIAELGYAWGKPSWLPVSKGDLASAFDGPRHLIRGGDGRFELFDIGTDQWEQVNFYGDSAGHPRTRGLQAIIEALPQPDTTGRPPPNDAAKITPGDE